MCRYVRADSAFPRRSGASFCTEITSAYLSVWPAAEHVASESQGLLGQGRTGYRRSPRPRGGSGECRYPQVSSDEKWIRGGQRVRLTAGGPWGYSRRECGRFGPGREEWEAGDSATRPGLSPSASTALLVAFRPTWRKSISRKVARSSGSRSAAKQRFLRAVSPDQLFSPRGPGEPQRVATKGAEYVHAHSDRFQLARGRAATRGSATSAVAASFAEYLAEDVHRHPDRELEAMASLAEWCDGDPELLAQARADVLRTPAERRWPSLRTTTKPSSCWSLPAAPRSRPRPPAFRVQTV
jgi:hypothetical protein